MILKKWSSFFICVWSFIGHHPNITFSEKTYLHISEEHLNTPFSTKLQQEDWKYSLTSFPPESGYVVSSDLKLLLKNPSQINLPSKEDQALGNLKSRGLEIAVLNVSGHRTSSEEKFPLSNKLDEGTLANKDKIIRKRYFTNADPERKSFQPKLVYYVDRSPLGEDISDSLLKLSPRTKNYELKPAAKSKAPWPGIYPIKRSPDIQVLTIDLMPITQELNENRKHNKTVSNLVLNTLLNKKLGKGNFLMFFQPPYNRTPINSLLEDVASVSKTEVVNINHDIGDNNAQVIDSLDDLSEPNDNKIVNLMKKSDAFYMELSKRLNNFYSEILEANSKPKK